MSRTDDGSMLANYQMYMVTTNRQIIRKPLHKAVFYLAIFLLSFLSLASCHYVAGNYTRDQGDTMANATTVVAGKPFFPFGFYHVSWDSTAEQRINALHGIAAAGFNTIHASIKSHDDFNEYGKFLDEAAQLGVHVISEFGVDRVTAVKKFKGKSAVLGWNIGDDASSHESANKLLQIHHQIKAADPNHLTYTSVAFNLDIFRVKNSYLDYAHVADLIGGQSYPIGLPLPLNNVYDVFNIACAEANKHNRPVIANLQTFRWAETSWKRLNVNRRWPTPDEVYNMTYQALLAGVKGIIFYTYYDSENQITEKQNLWNAVKSMAVEIKKLSPIFLNGKLIKFNTGVPDLLAGTWRYQEHLYVMVINTSYDTKTVSIQLPTPSDGKAKPMFPDRPSGMVIKEGKLSGSISPLNVHIYSLGSESQADQLAQRTRLN